MTPVHIVSLNVAADESKMLYSILLAT